jgi:hypothetical protein
MGADPREDGVAFRACAAPDAVLLIGSFNDCAEDAAR